MSPPDGVWPDALAGGAAAAVQGAPMLLTDTHSVPTSIRDELRRLAPDRIMLLGGTASVSSGAAADLATIAPVERVWGDDRYATALAVSRRVFGPDRPGLLLATGASYPDALAGVPATRATRGPILLTRTTSLASGTEAELSRLGPDTAYIIGGTASVSIAVPRLVQRQLGLCWAGFAPTSTSQEIVTQADGVSGAKLAFTLDMGGRLTGAADIVRYPDRSPGVHDVLPDVDHGGDR
ncbi:MAG: cell wall-binding repeat-containing protein [Tetrasphaera sp.]